MSRVFISHASEDAPVAQKICEVLERKGVACWIAPRDVRAGHDYGSEIIDGIDHARAMVLLLSDHANDSKFVKREVERAVSRGIAVLPMRLADIEPSKALELFISGTHWIDVWNPPIDQYVDRLIVAIDALDGSAEAVPAPAGTAPVDAGSSPATAPTEPKKRSAAPIVLVGVALLVLVAAAAFFGPGLFDNDAAPTPDDGGSGGGTPEQAGTADAPSDNAGPAVAQSPWGETTHPAPAPPTPDDPPADPDPPTPVVEAWEPADIDSLLTLLKSSYKEERSTRLQQIKTRLPKRLTAEQVYDLIYPYGSTDIDRYIRELTWLVEYLPPAISAEEALRLLKPTYQDQRSAVLALIADRLPKQLSAEQLSKIIYHDTSSDVPRYVAEVERHVERLPARLTIEQTLLLLKPAYTTHRSELITILESRLPTALSAQELSDLIYKYNSTDDARYLKELKRLHDRLPESLEVADVLVVLKPLYSDKRSDAIDLIEDRIPGQLTVEEFDDIAYMYTNKDVDRYYAELDRFFDRLPAQMTPKEVEGLLSYKKDQARLDLLARLAPRIETMTAKEAERLMASLGSGDAGGQRYAEALKLLLPKIQTLTAREADRMMDAVATGDGGEQRRAEAMRLLLPKIKSPE